jgi:hypothetical protein
VEFVSFEIKQYLTGGDEERVINKWEKISRNKIKRGSSLEAPG